MAIPAEVLTQPVTLSDSAIAQLKPLIADALAKPDNTAASLALRVYVAGASCSGMRYGLALDDKFGEDDTSFEQGGVKLVIDGESLPMLTGSVVDFVEGPNGKGFTVTNPNAQSGCGSCGHGCGSSDDESCCE